MPMPQDPVMLLSYINTQLRDHYASLNALCEDLEIFPKEIEQKLEAIGYTYSPSQNQFV